MENPEFKALNKEGELEILKNDDSNFTKTKRYLEPLIKQVLKRQNLNEEESNKLYSEIILDIPIAIGRFNFGGGEGKDYKFSTYFTWYIAQRINKNR